MTKSHEATILTLLLVRFAATMSMPMMRYASSNLPGVAGLQEQACTGPPDPATERKASPPKVASFRLNWSLF